MNLAVPMDRLGDRRSLSKSFDHIDREVDRTGLMQGLDSFEGQAFDLITSKAREVFDVSREEPKLRDKYGPGIGQQMLMARRLCEAGVGFVTVNYGGWDMHGQIANSLKQTAPRWDRAMAAFVEDTVARGLDKDILLVITGEFGRTPRVNGSAGRDHWAPLSTLALGRRRTEDGPGNRRIELQGRGAEDHADPAARPDGDRVPRARHPAGAALQRSDRPASADDRRRQANRRTGVGE